MRGMQEQNRKRTAKACDRCRLKRSRCENSRPCRRCRFNNSVCISSPKKRSRERVYPKGYVEALERQQSQLVAGLRGLYRCLQNRQGWPGQPLEEVEGGHPLTHDILERLDLLHPSSSTSSICEDSVEDLKRMQQKLLGIEMSLVRSRDLDLGGSHAESCPPLDEATTVESFPIKAHLFPTQCQDVWLADRELPADWLTQANDVAPEASQISWKMLLNDMTMTDQQAGSSHPLNELADFEEFSQPAICDRVYSDNNPTPDWNDIHHLDLSNLLQTPFSA